MKQTCTSVAIVCLAVILAIPPYGYAAGSHKNKMRPCNAEADEKGLSGEGKGPERKALMRYVRVSFGKTLEGSDRRSISAIQDEICSKDAGAQNLKGDERKKFMSTCLSN